MAKLYKYGACFMTDIAMRAGYDDVTLFQCCITPVDWHTLIDLGWVPYRKKLSPPIVQYLMAKFAPDYDPAKN